MYKQCCSIHFISHNEDFVPNRFNHNGLSMRTCFVLGPQSLIRFMQVEALYMLWKDLSLPHVGLAIQQVQRSDVKDLQGDGPLKARFHDATK